MNTKSFLVAAAVAGLMGAAFAPSVAVAKDDKVKCEGVNSCKGTSECKTASSECKGHNSCKGKGWVSMTKAECEKKGGKVKS